MKYKRFVVSIAILTVLAAGVVGCSTTTEEPIVSGDSPVGFETAPEGMHLATFAGGCFWCMQPPYDVIGGVSEVTVGYTGGQTQDPTYMDVMGGNTGHFEAIQVIYDPEQVQYEELLEVFWRQINPIDAGGQFADRGSQYRTAIFYHNEEQKELAEQAKMDLDNSGKFDDPIATLILPASEFFPAEEYHQDYYIKNPGYYDAYKAGSGRAGYLSRTWGN